jgi:hypothetical protein
MMTFKDLVTVSNAKDSATVLLVNAGAMVVGADATGGSDLCAETPLTASSRCTEAFGCSGSKADIRDFLFKDCCALTIGLKMNELSDKIAI